MKVDQEFLTPLVQRVLCREAVVVANWTHDRIYNGAGGGSVYRFAGTAQCAGKMLPWSLILKIYDSSAASNDAADWNYWKREALAYQSNLLNHLSGDLTAPRCLQITERSQGTLWIWLEDAGGEHDQQWPLVRYGLAARHLGQFNGQYLTERSLPSQPWLSHHWLRAWVARAEPYIIELQRALDNSLVKRVYSTQHVHYILELWREREELLNALEQLPQTFCHLDAFRRNLLSRRNEQGVEQTVAIDWAFTGKGAIGEEIAPLVLASLIFFEVEPGSAQELDEIVFQAYMSGLHDVGWRGSFDTVRAAYATAAGLRYGCGAIPNLLRILMNTEQHASWERFFNRSIEEIADGWHSIYQFLFNLSSKKVPFL